MPLQIQEGDRIDVTLGGTVVAGAIWAGAEAAGVYMNSGDSGQVVPVAVEGVFEVVKKAAATLDFAVGEMAFALSTGGIYKAVATGATIPIGWAVEAAATGATTVKVKLSR